MISSVANPAIQRVRRLRKRMWRERRSLFLVEGHRAVRAGMLAGVQIEELFVTARGARLREEMLADPRLSGARVRTVTDEVMQHLTSVTTAPDVLAIAPMSRAILAAASGPAVLLHEVRDPANAGGILAIAAGAGIETALASTGTVELHAPKVVRAAQGAHFYLRLITDVPAAQAAAHFRSHDARIIAIGGDDAIEPWRVDLTGSVLFVSDGEGAAACENLAVDARVGVSASPVVPSVAANVAAVMYERTRQEAAR